MIFSHKLPKTIAGWFRLTHFMKRYYKIEGFFNNLLVNKRTIMIFEMVYCHFLVILGNPGRILGLKLCIQIYFFGDVVP